MTNLIGRPRIPPALFTCASIAVSTTCWSLPRNAPPPVNAMITLISNGSAARAAGGTAATRIARSMIARRLMAAFSRRSRASPRYKGPKDRGRMCVLGMRFDDEERGVGVVDLLQVRQPVEHHPR